MKRYEAYKDSGVKWIGEIPAHWEVRRIKNICSCNDETLSETTNPDYRIKYVEIGDIDSAWGIERHTEYCFKDAPSRARRITHENDVIISTVRTYLRAIATIKEEGLIVSTGFAVVRPKNMVCNHFVAYNFYAESFVSSVISNSIGVNYPAISAFRLMSLKVSLPPLHEQQAIADYLKDKTSKIEQYIAQREKEVSLLGELKQSEIANVVTKGLNPDVPMKDSGIPWIGEIPAHWEVLRAKNMFCKEKREVRENDEVITCFRDGQVTLRKNRRTTGFTESFTEYGYQGVRKGDLVIHQMDAFAGAIGVSDSDGKGTSVYHCCTPKGDYNVYYYAFLLRRMAQSGYIQSLYRGIRERSSDFKFTVFGVQYLPVPPLSEQQAIVDYIGTRLAKIDQHIAGLTAEIEYLKEFKQQLISDAVTGQIKVTD